MKKVLIVLGLILTGLSWTIAAQTPDTGQEPTPDPLQQTATRLVGQATEFAATNQAINATPATTGGTPTPLAGLCNSVTFRPLDDVGDQIETALTDNGFEVSAVEVIAYEETTDCITFDVQRMEASIDVIWDDLNDEDTLGTGLDALLTAITDSDMAADVYDDHLLTVRFIDGNQWRGLELSFVTYREIMAIVRTAQDGDDLLDRLTRFNLIND